MKNKKNYWANLSKEITEPGQTKNKRPNTSDIEVDFYSKFLNKEMEILDIGAGSGLITNKIINKVKSIIAVEKFEGFSKFISSEDNVLVINADLVDFKIRKEFDGILCTGVSQCFEKKVMSQIYSNMFEMLKPGGTFISRMHCGLDEDIIINGYSEELGTNYFAEYRQIDSEKKLLSDIGYKTVETHDILPDTLNVWDNSRHFIFICTKS